MEIAVPLVAHSPEFGKIDTPFKISNKFRLLVRSIDSANLFEILKLGYFSEFSEKELILSGEKKYEPCKI